MTRETSIHAGISRYVDAGELAGAAALICRDGHVVQAATVGKRDLQSELPVERDTIGLGVWSAITGFHEIATSPRC